MKKRIISIMMVAVLILGCFTAVSFGESETKTMTDYREVIKSGKYVYCAAGTRLYKVNLKTKSKKKIAKISEYVGAMKLYKGYIYFKGHAPTSTKLYRVKTNGKYLKKLGYISSDYAISGNRIYYEEYEDPWEDEDYWDEDYWDEDLDEDFWEEDLSYTYTCSMKLNGKDKRQDDTYSVQEITKTSNVKGYSVKSVEIANCKFKFYLKTPSGKKIYLHKEYLYG